MHCMTNAFNYRLIIYTTNLNNLDARYYTTLTMVIDLTCGGTTLLVTIPLHALPTLGDP